MMRLTEQINGHIMQCAPHVKSRESAQLLIAANLRIKNLEAALFGLFDCIPEHRVWPNKMEDAVQQALQILKNDN